MAFLARAQAVSSTQFPVQDLHQRDTIASDTQSGFGEDYFYMPCSVRITPGDTSDSLNLDFPENEDCMQECRILDKEKFVMECRTIEPSTGRILDDGTASMTVNDEPTTRNVDLTEEDTALEVATKKMLESNPKCDCTAICSTDEAKSGTSTVARTLSSKCACPEHRVKSGAPHTALALSMLLICTSGSLICMFLMF